MQPRDSGRACAAILAAIVTVAAGPGTAAAQSAIRNMGWGDSTPGHMLLTFDCQDPPDDATLVVSFKAPVSDVVGIFAKVDMCTEPNDLPEWWRFDVGGGCREGLYEVSTNFGAGPGSHPVAWSGAVTTSVNLVPGYLWSEAMNRFLVTVVSTNGQPMALVPDTEYYAFKLRFRTPKGTCAGCEMPACFVLNELLITTSTGKVETMLFDGWARWQGDTSPGCPFVVPALQGSWGRLKAAYR
jgi:hypothetical protein